MDVTNRQVIQEKLQHENTRLRGDLLTVARRVSHDLRTPLGGILVAGETLQEILAETDPASLPLVTSLLSSAEELSQLIKRLSIVLKATADPAPPQLTPMGEAVSAACQRLESRIIKTGATLSQPESWPEVQGVTAWLEVVWWNLLANALQHAGPSPLLELGWRKEHEKIRFWVADHGPGVVVEKRGKLFQPFHQLHALEASQGFGLSIVQRLLELQGGTCDYQPNTPRGGVFSFALPAGPAPS